MLNRLSAVHIVKIIFVVQLYLECTIRNNFKINTFRMVYCVNSQRYVYRCSLDGRECKYILHVGGQLQYLAIGNTILEIKSVFDLPTKSISFSLVLRWIVI